MYRFFLEGGRHIQLLIHSDHLHIIEQPCIGFYTSNILSLSLQTELFFSSSMQCFLPLIHHLMCFATSWLNPLFRLGYEKKLEQDDMYKVLPEDASDRLGEELQW